MSSNNDFLDIAKQGLENNTMKEVRSLLSLLGEGSGIDTDKIFNEIDKSLPSKKEEPEHHFIDNFMKLTLEERLKIVIKAYMYSCQISSVPEEEKFFKDMFEKSAKFDFLTKTAHESNFVAKYKQEACERYCGDFVDHF